MDWLQAWYNWPFLIPLAIALAFIGFELLFGGISEVLNLGVDAGTDIDAGADGAFFSGLVWLGMGQIPLTIVFEVLFLSFGIIGLFVNSIWSAISPDITVALSLPIAVVLSLVGSMTITHKVAGWIARHLPSESTISRPAGGWEGTTGIAVSTITNAAGQVRVEGVGNIPDALINVKSQRPDATIQRGTPVVVMDYVPETNSYTVIPMETLS